MLDMSRRLSCQAAKRLKLGIQKIERKGFELETEENMSGLDCESCGCKVHLEYRNKIVKLASGKRIG